MLVWMTRIMAESCQMSRAVLYCDCGSRLPTITTMIENNNKTKQQKTRPSNNELYLAHTLLALARAATIRWALPDWLWKLVTAAIVAAIAGLGLSACSLSAEQIQLADYVLEVMQERHEMQEDTAIDWVNNEGK